MGIRSKFSAPDFGVAGQTGYLQGGFGIKIARQPQRIQSVPEWMHDKKEIEKFVRRQFPHASKFGNGCQCASCSHPKSRLSRPKCRCRWCKDSTRAAVWATVIHRWFVMGETDARIEMEHTWKPGTVGHIVQKIRRLCNGQRQDGLPRTGKPRGRPKKSAVSQPIKATASPGLPGISYEEEVTTA